MPKYGLNKYGTFKYGKYNLSAGGGSGSASLGPHVRYRIRTISHAGKLSDYTVMNQQRVSIPSNHWVNVRMRSNKGEWIRTHRETIQADALKVRVRSIESDSGKSEWVYAERGNLSN